MTNTYNICLIKISGLTITFQADTLQRAAQMSLDSIEQAAHLADKNIGTRVMRVFISDGDCLQEYTLNELHEFATPITKKQESYEQRLQRSGRGSFHRDNNRRDTGK